MQDTQLFEYAVIRVVPQVEREEFLNIGVILYCPKQKFLQAIITLNEDRLRAFSVKPDMTELKAHLRAFELIAIGGKEGGPIGELDAAARFRWLTAVRSTVVQTSRVHPGMCADPSRALIRLHEKLVL